MLLIFSYVEKPDSPPSFLPMFSLLFLFYFRYMTVIWFSTSDSLCLFSPCVTNNLPNIIFSDHLILISKFFIWTLAFSLELIPACFINTKLFSLHICVQLLFSFLIKISMKKFLILQLWFRPFKIHTAGSCFSEQLHLLPWLYLDLQFFYNAFHFTRLLAIHMVLNQIQR